MADILVLHSCVCRLIVHFTVQKLRRTAVQRCVTKAKHIRQYLCLQTLHSNAAISSSNVTVFYEFTHEQFAQI